MVPKTCYFTVAGSMNGVPTTYLVDTGAAVTLRTFGTSYILLEQSSLKPWTGNPLVGVTGEPLEVWESTVIDTDFAGERFRTVLTAEEGRE